MGALKKVMIEHWCCDGQNGSKGAGRKDLTEKGVEGKTEEEGRGKVNKSRMFECILNIYFTQIINGPLRKENCSSPGINP